MKRIFYVLTILSALVMAQVCQAYTAIAAIPDYGNSLSWSYGASSQKIADKIALGRCKEEIIKAGYAKLAAKCKVMTRAKGPGYGAVVCGDKGCSWVTSYNDEQAAVDSAWKFCDKAGYGNCQKSDIKTFYDDNWPGERVASNLTGGNCRPNTPTVRCQSNCANGDCIVTYENGCKMRVQIPAKFNPFNNQWEYPSPSC